MKYLLSFVLFLFALPLQSLQAATLIQSPQAATTIEERLLDSIDPRIFESSEIIGIGQIASIVRRGAPIQRLAALTQTQQGQGSGGSGIRMGQRLFTIMDDSLRSEATSLTDIDPTLAISSEIVDGDTDIDSVSVESGRMYAPRLSVDFQKFPIPTYAIMPSELQQKRMDKLNSQLQKRFGETVKADYQENVHYLRGTVKSERQKEVLELFVKMEPGIQEVRNEVIIRD